MLEQITAAIDAAAVSPEVSRFALHDVRPGIVVEPATVDEAAAVMRLASENNWRVECTGSGTQAFGNRRTRADIVIGTRKLTQVIEYDAADLVIGVQSGIPLRELQKEVGRNAQFFAQDPAANDTSTIGGVIATGRAGPSRFAYGTPRDHVLGLQIITGDGRVLNFGGRVVKNVAGFDVVRLIVGSAGTLGLITRAYLRLRPVPAADESMALLAADPQPLLEVAAFIVEENLEAVALEVVSPEVLRAAWTLLIRFHGNPESVADARARVVSRSAETNLEVQSAGKDDWAKLEQRELAALTTVRIADVPTRINATLSEAQRVAQKTGEGTAIAVHAGDGIARVLGADSNAENTAFAIGEARSLLSVTGGTVIVHSRSEELMRRVDAYGAEGPTLQLMGKLKQAFDPASILAPGRFVV